MIKSIELTVFIILAFLLLPTTLAAKGLDEIPEEIRKEAYNPELTDPDQPVAPSDAYREWKSDREPPWTIGYSSNYAGNTWRKGAMNRLMNKLEPKWQELGLIDEIIVKQSDLNDSVQIQQIRQMVDEGVDGIIICCPNITALNQAIKYAYDNGVAVVTFTGYVTSPYSINVSVNYHYAGYQIGNWMAKEINEEGNVLVIKGIPGMSGADSQHEGMLDGLGRYPDVNVAGEITHEWTSQIGQANTQKWLATHPQPLHGVATQSSGETGVLQAFLQSGREIPPISFGGEIGALCYWRNNPDFISAAYYTWPPGDEAEFAINTLMRVMQGQGPKIQSIMVPAHRVEYPAIEALLDTDCDRNSTEWHNPGIDKWAPADYVDQHFLRPADPESYQP